MRPPRDRLVLSILGSFPLLAVVGWQASASASASGLTLEAPPPATRTADTAEWSMPTVGAEARRPDLVPRRGRFVLTAGVRTDLVTSTGLDPFSDSDALAQSSLAVRYVVSPRHAPGFGAGLDWDHGSFSSTARGSRTQLDTDRFSLTIEGRLPLASHLFGVARVAPGILRRSARLTDGSIPDPAYSTTSGLTAEQVLSTVSVDGSLGLDLLVAEAHPGLGAPIGFWLTGDAGYSYSAGRNLVLASEAGQTPAGRTDEPIRLGQLALRGGFFRLAVSVSF
jgi:hypothetical protein